MIHPRYMRRDEEEARMLQIMDGIKEQEHEISDEEYEKMFMEGE